VKIVPKEAKTLLIVAKRHKTKSRTGSMSMSGTERPLSKRSVG